MNRKLTLILILLFPLFVAAQTLRVSENKRYLETETGKPFLWIGDTAWELFHKLNREDARMYLKNRAEKGFSVIQAVVIAEMDGLKTPNAYGETPLIGLDPETPSEKYFEHVDFIVNEAQKLGLFIGMLPTWGDKVTDAHGGGPVIFTETNARIYGEFLGKRYKNKPIVWILGGDRNIKNDDELKVWRAMANGIKTGSDGKQLISYHPRGASSSHQWLPNESWLDLDMYQSGHEKRYNDVYRYAETLYNRKPAKPFVDAEPAYEDIAIRFWDYCDWNKPLRVPTEVLDANKIIVKKEHFAKGFFTAHDVRVHAYWNFLSGASGYTYGNNAIWQMFVKGGNLSIPCLTDWREALDRPGAAEMKHVRTIFEARPFSELIPDQAIIVGSNPKDSLHIRAAISADQSFALVYLSVGQPVSIDLSKMKNAVVASWYNPREGTARKIGTFKNSGNQKFAPPSAGTNNDWLLVLDDKNGKYKLSGFAQKQKVWLDADTGSEMDDLYAIVRLVKDPTIELIGLSSAHFNNPDLLVFEKWNAYDSKGLNTVAESQRLNEQILKALGRLDITHPIGADRQIGRAWGQQDPRDSEAAQAIIAAIKALPEGEKLDILTIGAMTNLASALIIAPEIKSRIRCFALGAQYDPKTKIWNKNEFNIRNDLNAFDYLLNLEGLDLTMMCLQAALPLQFKREDTYTKLDETIEAEKILEDRWREQNPQDETRVMWDLALVEAYLKPAFAQLEAATTPHENKKRKIRAYVKIDEKALADDFWKVLKGKLFSLHPENPNYFLYKGKPTILVTSGEHYGAVMNADFDYEKYLLTLKKEGLNYTRIFLGPYSEMGDNLFGIRNNTMNPKPESWVTPWTKDPSSGKYDINRWNDVFFSRLERFVSAASENGIVVEVTLFTSYYTNQQWKTSPFNPTNNIQQFDSISFKQVNTINNSQLMEVQEKYVRKVVQELNPFGNLFFEIQNEPWSDNPNLVEKIAETDTLTHPFTWQKLVETAKDESLEWQKRIAKIITEEENNLPNKHLIAQNISNFRGKIENPDPNISIFNFHYAYPEAASQNLGLKKAIGLDETGFMPKVDFHYRSQAWKFMLAGGALYNNLDYSFIVGKEDGTHSIDAGTPGWGHHEYRKQLKIMKDFIESFDFISMKPDNSILQVTKGNVAEFQVLAQSGKQYAIYLDKGSLAEIRLQLPDGNYTAEWANTLTGSIDQKQNLTAKSGKATLICPEFQEDIVLRILKNK